MDVMTVGDAGYYYPMCATAKQLNKLHPNSNFYIYDWGLEENQLKELEDFDNVIVIPWGKPYDLSIIEKTIGIFTRLIRHNNSPTKKLVHKILETDDGYRKVWGPYRRKKELYAMERIPCIVDCSNRIQNELIFLDADAIPLAPINILDDDFDIGVTLRPPERTERAKNRGKYYVLNGGVVFFNTSPGKIRTFAEHWRKEAERCKIEYKEQTSLSRIIGEANSEIYSEYYNTGNIQINESIYKVKIFPCERWNYHFRIEDSSKIDPENNRILHLKSGRHTDYEIKELLERISHA